MKYSVKYAGTEAPRPEVHRDAKAMSPQQCADHMNAMHSALGDLYAAVLRADDAEGTTLAELGGLGRFENLLSGTNL